MKQLKSSSVDLRKIFETISAGFISEPFASFDAEADVNMVRSFMAEQDYDVIGVRRNGLVVGNARRSDLGRGALSDYMVEFQDMEIVDASAPLIELLRHMRKSPRVYVRLLGEVGGIITSGDLQKAPVRMWLFGVISLIEMQLLRIIRQTYRDDSWDKFIKPDRLDSARQILNDRKQKNADIDLADCLQFCDKRDIVIGNLWPQLGFESWESGMHLLKDVEGLRNNLAHSQDIVTGFWPGLINLADDAENFLLKLEST